MRVVITNMNAAVAHALALMLEQKAGYEIVAEGLVRNRSYPPFATDRLKCCWWIRRFPDWTWTTS